MLDPVQLHKVRAILRSNIRACTHRVQEAVVKHALNTIAKAVHRVAKQHGLSKQQTNKLLLQSVKKIAKSTLRSAGKAGLSKEVRPRAHATARFFVCVRTLAYGLWPVSYGVCHGASAECATAWHGLTASAEDSAVDDESSRDDCQEGG